MFKRNCPSCKKHLSWDLRKKLLIQDIIVCPWCTKRLTQSFKYRLINGGVYGAIVGVLLITFFNFEAIEVAIIAIFSGSFLQKYIDILFPLEVCKH
ncbi:hypothetical protein ACMAZF_19110 [Psychrobium sp. nBUS_13]|uniref:hypothetical protein n=1 Tax=Psychrobium sp. nBUS_13 TaxID=3395319 RepID=UPI003EBF9337